MQVFWMWHRYWWERLWKTWTQRYVLAACVVMAHPCVQDMAQVVRAQRDQNVQALPPERAQEPFTQGIRLGTAHRCFQDPETQMPHLLIELLGEHAVAVMDQETVAVINRDGFAKLLDRPLGRGVRRHIGMQDSAACVFHHHKHVERLEGGSDHDAEITGDNRLGMIAHVRWDALMP